jgi:hypothetical protein
MIAETWIELSCDGYFDPRFSDHGRLFGTEGGK